MVVTEKVPRIKKKVDELMKIAVRDVEDTSLKYSVVSKLLEIMELLDGRKESSF